MRELFSVLCVGLASVFFVVNVNGAQPEGTGKAKNDLQKSKDMAKYLRTHSPTPTPVTTTTPTFTPTVTP